MFDLRDPAYIAFKAELTAELQEAALTAHEEEEALAPEHIVETLESIIQRSFATSNSFDQTSDGLFYKQLIPLIKTKKPTLYSIGMIRSIRGSSNYKNARTLGAALYTTGEVVKCVITLYNDHNIRLESLLCTVARYPLDYQEAFLNFLGRIEGTPKQSLLELYRIAPREIRSSWDLFIDLLKEKYWATYEERTLIETAYATIQSVDPPPPAGATSSTSSTFSQKDVTAMLSIVANETLYWEPRAHPVSLLQKRHSLDWTLHYYVLNLCVLLPLNQDTNYLPQMIDYLSEHLERLFPRMHVQSPLVPEHITIDIQTFWELTIQNAQNRFEAFVRENYPDYALTLIKPEDLTNDDNPSNFIKTVYAFLFLGNIFQNILAEDMVGETSVLLGNTICQNFLEAIRTKTGDPDFWSWINQISSFLTTERNWKMEMKILEIIAKNPWKFIKSLNHLKSEAGPSPAIEKEWITYVVSCMDRQENISDNLSRAIHWLTNLVDQESRLYVAIHQEENSKESMHDLFIRFVQLGKNTDYDTINRIFGILYALKNSRALNLDRLYIFLDEASNPTLLRKISERMTSVNRISMLYADPFDEVIREHLTQSDEPTGGGPSCSC